MLERGIAAKRGPPYISTRTLAEEALCELLWSTEAESVPRSKEDACWGGGDTHTTGLPLRWEQWYGKVSSALLRLLLLMMFKAELSSSENKEHE